MQAVAKPVKRKKKARPDGFPVRPVSAFISFMNARRPDFVDQIGGKSSNARYNIGQVSKLAKAAWYGMSAEEKLVWTTSAAEKMQIYKEAVIAFKETNPPVPEEEEPKRPLGVAKHTTPAFILFGVDERPASIAELTAIKGEKPGFKEVAAHISSKWLALDDATKDLWYMNAGILEEAKAATTPTPTPTPAPTPMS